LKNYDHSVDGLIISREYKRGYNSFRDDMKFSFMCEIEDETQAEGNIASFPRSFLHRHPILSVIDFFIRTIERNAQSIARA
jgi:hypothetical protein